VDGDVGWPELGAEVVAVLAQLRGCLPCDGEVLVGLGALVLASCRDGEDEVEGAVRERTSGLAFGPILVCRAAVAFAAMCWAWSSWPRARKTWAMRDILPARARGDPAASAHPRPAQPDAGGRGPRAGRGSEADGTGLPPLPQLRHLRLTARLPSVDRHLATVPPNPLTSSLG
jgi:hypothetical protein